MAAAPAWVVGSWTTHQMGRQPRSRGVLEVVRASSKTSYRYRRRSRSSAKRCMLMLHDVAVLAIGVFVLLLCRAMPTRKSRSTISATSRSPVDTLLAWRSRHRCEALLHAIYLSKAAANASPLLSCGTAGMLVAIFASSQAANHQRMQSVSHIPWFAIGLFASWRSRSPGLSFWIILPIRQRQGLPLGVRAGIHRWTDGRNHRGRDRDCTCFEWRRSFEKRWWWPLGGRHRCHAGLQRLSRRDA